VSVLQLRLVLETSDLDAALAFYRDTLGLPELESYQGDGGARVAILGIPTATLELANSAQVAMINDVEVGRAVDVNRVRESTCFCVLSTSKARAQRVLSGAAVCQS
jgi:catechol 2,3-dioxygenase-like lactoylglutathione lyase family enzyme